MADLKRILDYDPTTRTKTIFHYDWKTDDTIFEEVQDVSSIVELNAAQRAVNKPTHKNDMWHVGRIPLNILFSVPLHCRYDANFWRDWLNRPENRAFKTYDGNA